MKKEIRNIGSVTYRAKENETESRTVEGFAAVFNSLSEDFDGWQEVIEPSAFDGVIDVSDVMALLNHNENRGVLARSRNGVGSLTLEIRENGLHYTFEAPNTALGDELLEGLRRGDISQSSFAFTVDSETWERREDGSYLRHINKVGRLYDVSPVYTPAYPDTSVAARSLEAAKGEQETAPMEQPNIEPKAPDASYYETLREIANI